MFFFLFLFGLIDLQGLELVQMATMEGLDDDLDDALMVSTVTVTPNMTEYEVWANFVL